MNMGESNRILFKEEKTIKMMLFIFIFITILIFFTSIHPVTIISGDEWINLSSGRGAYPEWGGFNPVKVVPEVSFPLFGNIAAFALMPLGFTFPEAIAYLTALLVAFLVVAFLHQFYMLLREKTNFSAYISCVLVIFYVLCLFGLFRTLDFNKSPYLLWEINLTCYYHYIVPALINSYLTIHFIRKSGDRLHCIHLNYMRVGFVILAIYLCVFLNIFASVLLAVYCGVVIFCELISRKYKILEIMNTHPFHIITLALWVASAIFEMNGGRAGKIGKENLNISGAFNAFISLLKISDVMFMSVLSTGVIFGATYLMKNRNDNSEFSGRIIFWQCVFSGIITTTALILISSKSSVGYATRPAAMWGAFMYLILSASIGLGYLVTIFKPVNYIVPVVILLLINKTTDQTHSLRESHNENVTFSVANAISQNIIDQVITAVNENKKEMVLYVPKGKDADNWPFPLTRGKAINETLRSNGITHGNIGITMKPDEELNKRFGFPL